MHGPREVGRVCGQCFFLQKEDMRRAVGLERGFAVSGAALGFPLFIEHPAAADKLQTEGEALGVGGCAEKDDEEAAGVVADAAVVAIYLGLAPGAEGEAEAGFGGEAGFDAFDTVGAEEAVSVAELDGEGLAGAEDFDSARGLACVEVDVAVGVGVAAEAGEVGGGGVGEGAFAGVDAVGVEEEGAAHVEAAGEGVHVGDEVADGVEAGEVGEAAAGVFSEGGGGDVVGGHHGAEKEVAHGELVADLEADGVMAAGLESAGGDFGKFVEAEEAFFGGVEDDDGGGDFREAGDLRFAVGFEGFEDVAASVVNDNVTIYAEGGCEAGQEEGEG